MAFVANMFPSAFPLAEVVVRLCLLHSSEIGATSPCRLLWIIWILLVVQDEFACKNNMVIIYTTCKF